MLVIVDDRMSVAKVAAELRAIADRLAPVETV
jgi:uncharacterized coiled-coil protein SlyX